jgi:transcriptional regulator with XRE-family HTH domain
MAAIGISYTSARKGLDRQAKRKHDALRRIRQRRETMGMRQIDRTRAMGFKDPNTSKNYEMGRLPRRQVLARLTGALEVTIDWILVRPKK